MLLTLDVVNEVKLVALFSYLVIALLTGLVTGLALGWRRGGLSRLGGITLGSGVGVTAVVILALMFDSGGVVPVVCDPDLFTFSNGPDIYGDITVGWTVLYAVRVGAIILSTKFVTTSLWSLAGVVAARFVMRPL